MSTNSDGQPVNKSFNHSRVSDRKIDELIGICKGVLCDGVVTQSEAEFLQSWLERNKSVADTWPANILYSRIHAMLEDNILDEDEEKELLETLLDITGGALSPGDHEEIETLSTALPLCRPAPDLEFAGKSYCLTGKFASGSRAQVEAIIKGLGATTSKNPIKTVDYLVVGVVGSSDWIHSTHGRKIERAVELKEEGLPISIVAEEHLVSFFQ